MKDLTEAHTGMTKPLTTVTDEQIMAYRFDPLATQQERQLCSVALDDFGMHPRGVRMNARAAIVSAINARRAQEGK